MSPALSSASTADGEASPELPPLPAPRLPDRVRGLLRTPPDSPPGSEDGAARSAGNHWGSPYPPHLRPQSVSSESPSSEASEDSPIYRLELETPYLRPAPPVQEAQPEVRLSGISAAAAVLANRARRLANGITEVWIRQHTAGGSDQEKRHWFSDGTGDSDDSSLSDSFSGEEAAWLGSEHLRTPRASRRTSRRTSSSRRRHTSRNELGKQSSSETLRQERVDRRKRIAVLRMASADKPAPSGAAERPRTPTNERGTGLNGTAGAANGEPGAPATPTRAIAKQKQPPNETTPRVKKKVPWRGKNLLVLLPRDDERGQPGKRPMPLTESEIMRMLRSWEELGYNIAGFDLCEPADDLGPPEQSRSKGPWPDPDDMARERKQGGWKVVLPDLNGGCALPSKCLDSEVLTAGGTCSVEEIRGRAERGEAPRLGSLVRRRRSSPSALDLPGICCKQAGVDNAVSSATLLAADPISIRGG